MLKAVGGVRLSFIRPMELELVEHQRPTRVTALEQPALVIDIAADLIRPYDHVAVELSDLACCTVIAVKRCPLNTAAPVSLPAMSASARRQDCVTPHFLHRWSHDGTQAHLLTV